MNEITSLHNPLIKYVVKLREDKRQRKQDKFTIVEGRYELELVFSSRIKPKEVFYCKEMCKGISNIPSDTSLISVSRPVFEKMSQRENPDGWIAIVPIIERNLNSIPLSINPFLVLVEGVEKPGNLGAIFRTADAAGVDGLLVSDPVVDITNPNVIRASRGTLFTVNAVEVDNISAYQWLKKNNILIIASSPAVDYCYTKVDFNKPVCILVGSEDAGLSQFWMKNAEILVTIPMKGKVNSLNVSASAAILLYEVVRQRRR